MNTYITESGNHDIVVELRRSKENYKNYMKKYKDLAKEGKTSAALKELYKAKLSLTEVKKKINDIPLDAKDNVFSSIISILSSMAVITVAQGAVYGLTKGGEKIVDYGKKTILKPDSDGNVYVANEMFAQVLDGNKAAINGIGKKVKISPKSIAITAGSSAAMEGIRNAFSYFKNSRNPKEAMNAANIFKKRAIKMIDNEIKKIDKLIAVAK